MIYVTQYSREDHLTTVGWFEQDGSWHGMRDCECDTEAHRFINYLNGGSGMDFGEIAEVGDLPTPLVYDLVELQNRFATFEAKFNLSCGTDLESVGAILAVFRRFLLKWGGGV